MNRKTILIEGDNFSTLESFYIEIDRVLTKDLNWKTGHNLNAFNDLLRGGFGDEYNEPIKLIWQNSVKSKTELCATKHGLTIYQTLVDIIKDQPHIEFIEN